MRHRALTIIAAALAVALAGPAIAAGPNGCPPGLAKKNNGCMPPGLAKKGGDDRYDDRDDDRRARRDPIYVDRDGYVRLREYDGYRRGDLYVDRNGYVRLRDYDRYRLPRLRDRESYYRNGDVVLRVDRETRQILELIRLTDLILSN